MSIAYIRNNVFFILIFLLAPLFVHKTIGWVDDIARLLLLVNFIAIFIVLFLYLISCK